MEFDEDHRLDLATSSKPKSRNLLGEQMAYQFDQSKMEEPILRSVSKDKDIHLPMEFVEDHGLELATSSKPKSSKHPPYDTTPMEMESIMCVVENWPGTYNVDYYISNKNSFIEFEKRYREKEKEKEKENKNKYNWVGEKVGRLAKSIKPFCSSERRIFASYIVFNSCLYRIGGSDTIEESRSVEYLDLSKMDKVWLKGPEMNQERIYPYPVILSGQLYVVGGLVHNYGKKLVLMEVLKRDGSGWEEIPNPPPYPEVPPPYYHYPEEEKKEKEKEKEQNEEEEEEEEEEEGEEEAFGCVYDEEDQEDKHKPALYNLSDCDDYDYGEITEKERLKYEYFTSVYSYAIVGAVEIEGKTVIVVGVNNGYIGEHKYALYTYEYEAEDDINKRHWKSYTKIDLSDLRCLRCLPSKPAVVSGQLMVFIQQNGGLLFVLDFSKDKLYVFDLFEKIPDLTLNMCNQSPFLNLTKEGEFEIFWAIEGPKSKLKKSRVLEYSISTLVSSSFILKRKSASFFNTNTSLYVEVTNKLNWFSLIPQLECPMLSDVIFLPTPSKHDLGLKDLMASSKIVSNQNLIL